METRSPFFGFLIAPIVPSLLFAFGALALGMSDDKPLILPWWGYLLGVFIWFIYGAIVAYPTIIIIGVPGYLILKKANVNSLKAYLIGGTLIGALAPLFTSPFFGLKSVLNFEYYVFIISAIFGITTCWVFWLITIKRP